MVASGVSAGLRDHDNISSLLNPLLIAFGIAGMAKVPLAGCNAKGYQLWGATRQQGHHFLRRPRRCLCQNPQTGCSAFFIAKDSKVVQSVGDLQHSFALNLSVRAQLA